MTQDKLEKLKTAIKDGMLVQAAGGITTTVTQSDKLGYDWKNFFVNDVPVRREYVEQVVKFGTVDNPIVWKAGMSLIQNAYYANNGEIKVWTGEAGAIAEWSSNDFVAV